MSEMEKVKIELFEKPINYNYSGFKGENWHLIIFYTFNQLRNRHIKKWNKSFLDGFYYRYIRKYLIREIREDQSWNINV